MSKIVLPVLFIGLLVLSGCGSSVMAATGSVVDQNGHGLQDARVVFEGNDLFLIKFTNVEGNYKIEDLEPGSYTVSATHEGCDDLERSYEYAGGNVEMDLTMACDA